MSLSIRGITKRFGDLTANDDINLDLEPGALHAVLGENGAGKSTLMKILAGTVHPDQGEVAIDGIAVTLGSPRACLAAGIGMLAQEPMVCLPFTNRENFRLGSSWSLQEAGDLLIEGSRRLGFRLKPGSITRTLGVGERQQLEMVRLLARGINVLILDEPTSGLTGPQRELLFEALRRLAADGLIVLFVSHKLEEVNELCRSVTVMRRGQVVATTSLPRPESELVDLMFEGSPLAVKAAPVANDPNVVVESHDVTATSGRQSITSFDVHAYAGEVIGIAGLEGSGQGALLRALAGLAHVSNGRVIVDGGDLTNRSPIEFRRRGVAFLSGGRLEEGLLPGLTIAEHFELADGERRLIDWKAGLARAREGIETFRIKGGPQSSVNDLSGGNQQRLLLALLPPKLRLLLMEHPTRGLDLESAAYLWGRLRERRRHGTAIVFSSSDLDEIVTYADRVMVVFDGRVIALRSSSELTQDELGFLLGGLVTA